MTWDDVMYYIIGVGDNFPHEFAVDRWLLGRMI